VFQLLTLYYLNYSRTYRFKDIHLISNQCLFCLTRQTLFWSYFVSSCTKLFEAITRQGQKTWQVWNVWSS